MLPPLSLVEAAFIAISALVTGLVTANYAWRDVRYRRPGAPALALRLVETIAASAFLALAAGMAAWAVCLIIEVARVNPLVLPVVIIGLYLLMAVQFALDHFRRYRGFFGALLVGILWLPLMVLLRRV